jgi:aryl-alcohol dehydrogenase-like predicted oxidoreductase
LPSEQRLDSEQSACSFPTQQSPLAWLLAQQPWIVPIPGTRRLERLDENLGALAVELTAGDLAAIDTAAGQINVRGNRYPEAMQKMIDRPLTLRW